MKVEILGVAHPRTGTAFTSKLCQLWGLDVGHEKAGKDGLVSWMLSKPHGPYPWNPEYENRPEYNHLIYNVRNPLDSLPSIIWTEDGRPTSLNFRKHWLKFSDSHKIERAIDSLIGFHENIMELNPNVVYKVETEQKKLFDYLSQHYDITYVQHNVKENSRQSAERRMPGLQELIKRFGVPSQNHMNRLNNLCVELGYNKAFK